MPPTTQHPIILELFQSQSCSACPPFNNNLLSLLSSSPSTVTTSKQTSPLPSTTPQSPSQSPFLLLSYHITYHNALPSSTHPKGEGWIDTFSHAAFTTRQEDYIKHLSLPLPPPSPCFPSIDTRGPFTPQLIINGKTSALISPTSDIQQLKRLLEKGVKEAKNRHQPRAEIRVVEDHEGEPGEQGRGVMICISRRPHSPSSAEAEPDLDIWLITYEPANLEVAITSGENKGKTLKYVNVVRRVESVGFLGLEESGGGEFWVDLDSYGKDGEGEGQGLVVLVQKGEGGEIVDAVTL